MLNALILCGGKSSRMGEDKGSLLFNDGVTTWAGLVMTKCESIGINTYISVNESQLETYGKLFSNEKLIVDNFDNVEGPLKGILSAHKVFKATDWLVIACDMLTIEPTTISELINEFYKQKNEYCIFESNGIQPFPGIYSQEFLKWLYNFYLIGHLKTFSLKSLINNAKGQILDKNDSLAQFANINTPVEREKHTLTFSNRFDTNSTL